MTAAATSLQMHSRQTHLVIQSEEDCRRIQSVIGIDESIKSDGSAHAQISRGSVYSLHKSSTRAHIKRVADKELSAASAEVLAQLRYDLPASYAFHRWVFTSPLNKWECLPFCFCGARAVLALGSLAGWWHFPVSQELLVGGPS